MTASVDCPLCEYTAEKDTVQEARNSVRSHMSSKVDEDHKGVGYQKATQLLDISDIEAADIPAPAASASQAPEESSALDDTDDGREAARTDGSGLGLDGKPDTTPSDADDEGDEELVCTDCEEGLEVTDAELEAADNIASGDILTCECGHEMRWVA